MPKLVARPTAKPAGPNVTPNPPKVADASANEIDAGVELKAREMPTPSAGIPLCVSNKRGFALISSS